MIGNGVGLVMFREVLKTQALRLVLGVGGLALAGVASAEGRDCLRQTIEFFDAPPRTERVVHTGTPPAQRDGLASEVVTAIERRGPNGQEMAAQILPDGRTGTMGTRWGVEMARGNASELAPLVFKITGTSQSSLRRYTIDGVEVSLELASSLVGSGRLTREFSDLDTELTILVKYNGFTTADFKDPDSIYNKALEKFFGEYLNETQRLGFVFSELKAGEYDFVPQAARASQSRAIKWTLTDFFAGSRNISTPSAGQQRSLTFRQALTSDSRVKFDWIFKLQSDPKWTQLFGLTDRYVEGSVVINFAGQRGTNTPVPFMSARTAFPEINATGGHLAIEGRSNGKPLKITSLFFDPRHLELARQLSVVAPYTDLVYFNQIVINASRAYWDQGRYFKTVRLLSNRLNYWDDSQAFFEATKFSKFDLIRNLANIASDPVSRALYYWVESVKPYVLGISLGIVDRDFELQARAALSRLIESDKKQFEQVFSSSGPSPADPDASLDSLVSFVTRSLEARVRAKVDEDLGLKRYLDYVFGLDATRSYSLLSDQDSFVSYQMPESFRSAYTAALTHWSNAYPNLHFTTINDLHMTIAFVGQIPVHLQPTLATMVRTLQSDLAKMPVTFEGGSFRVIGRNNAQLALVFDSEHMPRPLYDRIQAFKTELIRLGVQVDRHFAEFTPHISIAHLSEAYRDPVTHAQLARFLGDQSPDTLLGASNRLSLDRPAVQFQNVNLQNTQRQQSRYSDSELLEILGGSMEPGT